MKKHSKPSTVEVEHIETGNRQTLTLEEAQRLLRIEKKNGFNNWKLATDSKYKFVDGSLITGNTAANQGTEGENPITEGAAG